VHRGCDDLLHNLDLDFGRDLVREKTPRLSWDGMPLNDVELRGGKILRMKKTNLD
jgi:hypothetical protein